MKATEEKLTAKQERALVALLDCGEMKRAATTSGVNETTLWRWLQQPAFQARYRAARRQLVETAIAQLQSDCIVAVRVLREVAEDREAPASARVAAAKTIIDGAVRGVELRDLAERVENLEALREGSDVPRKQDREIGAAGGDGRLVRGVRRPAVC
jgi:hypothetical protein